MDRSRWPAPGLPAIAVVAVVGSLLIGKPRQALVLGFFSFVVIAVGTVVGNYLADRREHSE